MKKVELLAPAKNYECGKTAVDFGADALYIGGPNFGARHGAGNSVEEIARLTEYAHQFGVRIYVTLNTIIYDDELAQAEKTARSVIEAGVDALIIQDPAFLRMGLSGVEFHASTQMFNTSPSHVRFLQESGFTRVILERGLSLDQIKEIKAWTDVELEFFVHGAICVGYSGRCYLSRSMSERSGNRGDCMQACRLTWDLENRAGEKLLRNKHLLSVQDMDLSSRVRDLLDAGITSFKIEGRLKDINYVRNIVAHYRTLLDTQIASRPGMRKASSGRTVYDFVPSPEKSFTRGGGHWMLDGKVAGVYSPDSAKAKGEPIGKVTDVNGEYFTVDSLQKPGAGDGICFMSGGALAGTNINRVEGEKIFPNKMFGIKPGAEIFRNYDHSFAMALNSSRTRRSIEAWIKVTVDSEAILITATDEDGLSAEIRVANRFSVADNTSAMAEAIRRQLGKSGGSLFSITKVEIEALTDIPFLPASVLNSMRRELLEILTGKRKNLQPERNPAVENIGFPVPDREVSPYGNVVNSLAAKFYTDHGADRIETGMDAADNFSEKCVMLTPFCLRRETGMCLKMDGKHRDGLWLVRGSYRYRLDFDCARCEMKIIKE